MADSPARVILCRGVAVEGDDSRGDYERVFGSAGFVCEHLNVLNFRFSNLESLAKRLRSPDSYSGLILTSRRAIEAIGLAMDGKTLPEAWKNSPAYCVGPATSRGAREQLHLPDARGSECGNSRELADLLTSESNGRETPAPLLYPCSALARDTIEVALRRARVNYEKIVAYETTPSGELSNDLTLLLSDNPKIFVFFSPSSVEFVLDSVKKNSLDIGNIRAVAIGPATAEALEKFDLETCAVSARPEPIALLDAIRNAEL